MATISGELASLAARQHGVVTSDDLRRHGVTADAQRQLVRRGVLVRVHRGVVRVATAPDTFESRCVAASVGAGAVVTGLAAARLWECRLAGRPELPIVLVPHGSHSIAAGAIVRRTNRLDDEDRRRRDDGILLASPARTWFDCARDVGDSRFEGITEWVLDRHTSLPTLWRTTRRLAASGRPGSARVRRVMERRSDWQRPSDSMLELSVLNGLGARGVPELVRQHAITLLDGSIIHVDGADIPTRWAVEVDHVTWHGGRFDAQRDKHRDRALRRAGWVVERITDQEMQDDARAALDDLASAYAAHVQRQPPPLRRSLTSPLS
ncbi:MAG: type IV toxin-antitoxin system AbiEi family antitoxin domain-containing protein [Actinomycetota bacterium]